MATSATSGRSYVGSTTCALAFRRDGHRRAANAGSDLPFHRAIRKHGMSDFTWCVLDEREEAAELRFAEEEWISRMDTFRKGYNATPLGAGGSVAGWNHTKKTRAKMIAAHAARSDEEKERLRELKRTQMIGNTHGTALKGCKFTPEHKARISAALTGVQKSEAHCANMSQARRGHKFGPEARAAMAAAHVGLKHSEETKAKMSAAQKGLKLGRRQSPEHAAARLAATAAARLRGAA